jgi:hypothetical protein
MRRVLKLAVMAAVVTACGSVPLAPLEEPIGEDSALGRTIVRDTSAPVQTDSLVYHLSGDTPWYGVGIPFRYRNDTGLTISVINCHRGLAIGLEKRVEDRWEKYFEPVLMMCLSAPMIIQSGAIFSDTARIYGAVPGHNSAPEFGSSDLDGEYRLVWSNLVHDYDHQSVTGKPVGPLRSNPFLLVAP